MELKKLPIVFDELQHRYFIHRDGCNKELQGITGTIVKWMFPDTYAGVDPDVLHAAATRGTYIHSCIQISSVVGATPDCPESAAFLRMVTEHGMKVIAHEYIVSDMEQFASMVDVVLADEDGGVWLADIKTTSALLEPKVRLQLSIYALFFELNNPDLHVKGLVEIWLPKKGKPAWVVLPRTSANDTRATIDAYRYQKDDVAKDLMPAYCNNDDALPAKYAQVIAAIATLERTMKEAKENSDRMKEELLKVFRENGRKKFENDTLVITYVAPTTRTSIDSKKLKSEYPDAFDACQKVSEVKDTIKIKLK